MATPAHNLNDKTTLSMPAPGTPGAVVYVTITAQQFLSCSDPTDAAVLLFWMSFPEAGQYPSTDAVWAHMVARGVVDDDQQPIRRKTVQDSVERLAAAGNLPMGEML